MNRMDNILKKLLSFLLVSIVFMSVTANCYAYSGEKADVNYLPNRVVTYTGVTYYGGSSLTAYANIETQYLPSGNRFVRLERWGYLEDRSQEYSFIAYDTGYQGFSNSSCTVYYKGCWKNNRTNVMDLTIYTYTFTFYPEPII